MFHSPAKQDTMEIASMIAHLKNVGNLPMENNVSASLSTILKKLQMNPWRLRSIISAAVA
jgi:hypothetical protein